jgi:Autographiviridae endonuclease VII
MKTKYCGTCERFLRCSRFSPDSSSGDGLYSNCKDCRNSYRKKYRQLNYAKRREQSQLLVKKYGITLEQQEAMLIRQEGKCAICGTTEPGGKYNKWQTDHSHRENGVVRGLLCYRCNTGLGNFKDNVLVLFKAAIYLTKGESIENNSSVL